MFCGLTYFLDEWRIEQLFKFYFSEDFDGIYKKKIIHEKPFLLNWVTPPSKDNVYQFVSISGNEKYAKNERGELMGKGSDILTEKSIGLQIIEHLMKFELHEFLDSKSVSNLACTNKNFWAAFGKCEVAFGELEDMPRTRNIAFDVYYIPSSSRKLHRLTLSRPRWSKDKYFVGYLDSELAFITNLRTHSKHSDKQYKTTNVTLIFASEKWSPLMNSNFGIDLRYDFLFDETSVKICSRERDVDDDHFGYRPSGYLVNWDKKIQKKSWSDRNPNAADNLGTAFMFVFYPVVCLGIVAVITGMIGREIYKRNRPKQFASKVRQYWIPFTNETIKLKKKKLNKLGYPHKTKKLLAGGASN